jgi:hypothetical protein
MGKSGMMIRVKILSDETAECLGRVLAMEDTDDRGIEKNVNN